MLVSIRSSWNTTRNHNEVEISGIRTPKAICGHFHRDDLYAYTNRLTGDSDLTGLIMYVIRALEQEGMTASIMVNSYGDGYITLWVESNQAGLTDEPPKDIRDVEDIDPVDRRWLDCVNQAAWDYYSRFSYLRDNPNLMIINGSTTIVR